MAIASATTPGTSSGGAEHVDHIDLVRDVAQRRIGRLAEQRLARYPRIDGDHAIAFALKVLHHEVAGTVPVRRRADQRDRLHPFEDRADLRVGIGDRFQVGHALTLSHKGEHSSATPSGLQAKGARPADANRRA